MVSDCFIGFFKAIKIFTDMFVGKFMLFTCNIIFQYLFNKLMGSQQSRIENNKILNEKLTDQHQNLRIDQIATQYQLPFQMQNQNNFQKCKFLNSRFRQNKRASKKIEFEIKQSKQIPTKNPISNDKNSCKQNICPFDMVNIEKTDFIIQKTGSVIFGSLKKSNQKNGLALPHNSMGKEEFQLSTRSSAKSSLTSYNSQYKTLNINQATFVKVNSSSFQSHYQLQQKIGEGAFGQVFKARCRKTHCIRAVKILRKKVLKQYNETQKLHMELNILKSLDHPNIIKVYDVFHTEQYYYVVTQYCAGGSLRQYNKKMQYNIDPKIIKIILKQLLGALSYIHSQSIIHRDIKLENIVFDIDPQICKIQDIQIKIIDFGLAMKAKYKEFNKEVPYKGTPFYMAPQVLKGKYSTKTDIWSCGVLLYLLLTKQFPFKAKEIVDVYNKIQNQNIDIESSIFKNREIDEDAKYLIKDMLQKNGIKRFSASQALLSPWLNQMLFQSKTKTMEKLSFFNKLQQYENQNNLITFIQTYLIHLKTTGEQRQSLIKLFQKIDKNNNGVIDANQLSLLNPNINYQEQQKDYLKHLIQKIDKNSSGKIQISEFLAIHTDRVKLFKKQYLQQAFDYLDSNNNGYIDKIQLKKALKGCQNNELIDLWNDIDKNNDQKISKQQFLQYLLLLEDHKKNN